MCARYASAQDVEVLAKTYHLSLAPQYELPTGLIYPHTLAPVILRENGKKELRLMNYSLIPKWSKVRKPKFVTYNARIEDILTKPTWRDAFPKRHCLVPIQFFVESVYEGPFAGHNIEIGSLQQELLTAAGIWESWLDQPTGEVIDSFAMLTTKPPDSILQAGHDRCPVFLTQKQQEVWLEDKKTGKEWVQFLESMEMPNTWSFQPREKLKNKVRDL